jgi:hypothetical protein
MSNMLPEDQQQVPILAIGRKIPVHKNQRRDSNGELLHYRDTAPCHVHGTRHLVKVIASLLTAKSSS